MTGAERVPESARFVSTSLRGEVSAALLMPDDARAMLAYGHGAGAGLHHAFMRETAQRLAARGIASLRYHFPYMEAGRKAPDRPPVLIDTVTAAVRRATELAEGLPVFAGGKSMGGRMTSTASSEVGFEDVRGIVFFGFPLHAPNRPSSDRGAHLAATREPLLFLQGTRDALASLDLLEPIISDLGSRATLHIIDGADHSFHVLKRSGRTDDEVLDELADRVARWVDEILAE
ncbi:MAG: alpha/beta family hydrolase [Gemmatimonadota bacterium]|nr:alpha/beta family hydrolase [Gemmatimonadota bacterium]